MKLCKADVVRGKVGLWNQSEGDSVLQKDVLLENTYNWVKTFLGDPSRGNFYGEASKIQLGPQLGTWCWKKSH